jgi:hypothetical protein
MKRSEIESDDSKIAYFRLKSPDACASSAARRIRARRPGVPADIVSRIVKRGRKLTVLRRICLHPLTLHHDMRWKRPGNGLHWQGIASQSFAADADHLRSVCRLALKATIRHELGNRNLNLTVRQRRS